MKTYKAVIFDLFDTLVDFDRTIPTVVIDGRDIRSTAGNKVLAQHAPHTTFYITIAQRRHEGIAGHTRARSSRNPTPSL